MANSWLNGCAGALAGLGLICGMACSGRDSVAHGPIPKKNRELAKASGELLRSELPGVELEMDMTELLSLRPKLHRQPRADRDQLTVYEEELGPRQRALYFFADATPRPRLARVQIASELAQVDAIVERVLALQQRMGAPSGVWDCPAEAGQLPTRRYGYQRKPAAAVDIYAIIGEHALATYYVASSEQQRTSLRESGCQPTAPEQAGRFPAVPAPQ